MAMDYSLKDLLEMASEIEPSKVLSQELVMLAVEVGRKNALKNGIMVNVKLNAKRQVNHITNYESNATIIMDDDVKSN